MESLSFRDWLYNTELITDDEVQSPVNLAPNPQPLQSWENFSSEESLMNNNLLSDPLYTSPNTELSQGKAGGFIYMRIYLYMLCT